MKIIFALILFLMANSFLCQNQYQWAPNGAVWNYSAGASCVSGGFAYPGLSRRVMYKQADSISISADNSFYYNYFNFQDFTFSSDCNAGYFGNGVPLPYFGYKDGVVYHQNQYYEVISPIDSSYRSKDDTVVNFNASIGDTWYFYDQFDSDYMMPYYNIADAYSGITSVLDTGSRTINGELLKWVYVSYNLVDPNVVPITPSSYYDTIFERLGPKLNLFPSEFYYGFDVNYGGGTQFACYSDSTFGWYIEDSNVCSLTSELAIMEFSNLDVSIYPNPVSNQLNVVGTDLKKLIFKLYNILGVEVLSEKMESDKTIVEVGDLPRGIYIVTFYRDNQKVYSEKLVKR